KVEIALSVKVNTAHSKSFDPVIIKMGNVGELKYVKEKATNSFTFIEKNNEYFIPFGENIDLEAEKTKIKDERAYSKGALEIVRNKLSNESFVNNAPENVVAVERKKEEDALNKIKILEENLAELN